MTKFKYTIIIPHYNNIDGLRKLIKSIPDRMDISIVVVDDCSNANINFDNISHFNCASFHLILNVKNGGAGACRNIGLSYVESKWIIFADSDDYFSDDAFDYFDSYYSSNSDIIYFKVDSVDEFGFISDRNLDINRLVEELHFSENQDIRYSVAVPWGKMIKTELVLDNNIIFDEVRYSNDMFFSIKSGIMAKSVQACLGSVYIVVRRRGSLTTTINKNSLLVRKLVSIKVNEYLYIKNKKQYQTSLLKFLVSYRNVLTLSDLWYLIKSVLLGRNIIFPRGILKKIISGDFIFLCKRMYSNKK